MKADKILVTGGAGFIGSRLCAKLAGRGTRVVCMDNFHTGRAANLESIPGTLLEIVRRDVSIPFDFEADAIFNLACPASPPHYQADPVHTMKTCVIGALNVLELAKRLSVPVLQASTSEVYGDPDVHPQPESYRGNVNPVGIRSCYDEGKRCAETLFSDFRRQFGVDSKIVRIFNTYGPGMRMDDGRVVSNFIVQALRGDDITIYGEGSQTRSFCYVDDLVDALLKMMDSPASFGGPVNLGNPDEHTVLELAELIIEMTSSKSKIVRRPLPDDDPARRKPDISLAREKLSWTPVTDIRSGLAKTIEYFKKSMSD